MFRDCLLPEGALNQELSAAYAKRGGSITDSAKLNNPHSTIGQCIYLLCMFRVDHYSVVRRNKMSQPTNEDVVLT